jgi:hypothetical protein
MSLPYENATNGRRARSPARGTAAMLSEVVVMGALHAEVIGAATRSALAPAGQPKPGGLPCHWAPAPAVHKTD